MSGLGSGFSLQHKPTGPLHFIWTVLRAAMILMGLAFAWLLGNQALKRGLVRGPGARQAGAGGRGWGGGGLCRGGGGRVQGPSTFNAKPQQTATLMWRSGVCMPCGQVCACHMVMHVMWWPGVSHVMWPCM